MNIHYKTSKGLRLLLVCLLGFIAVGHLSAQGWEEIFGDQYSRAQSVLPSNDGNIWVSGDDVGTIGNQGPGELEAYLMKYNQFGDRILQKYWDNHNSEFKLTAAPDANFIGSRIRSYTINGTSYGKTEVLKFDESANIIWEFIPLPDSAAFTDLRYLFVNDLGEIAILTDLISNGDRLNYQVLNSGGQLIHNSLIDFNIGDVIISKPNNGIYRSTFENFDYLEIFEYNNAGIQIGYQAFPTITNSILHPQIVSDDLVFFQSKPNEGYFQTKIDLASGVEFSKLILPSGISPQVVTTLADGFVLAGLKFDNPSGILNGMMAKSDFQGNLEWLKIYDHLASDLVVQSVQPDPSGGFIASGYNVSGPNKSWIFRTDEFGNIYPNSIAGQVAIDNNEDCEYNTGEVPLEDWVVSAKKGEQTLVTLSESDGSYVLPVDTGDYQIEIYPPNDLWFSCQAPIIINFPTTEIDTFLDFPLGINVLCPNLTINHSIPSIRPCFERPSFINYCNYGTDTAFNAYIDISYDSLITPISSTTPWNTLPENSFRFALGDIAPLECGAFTVNLFLDCDAEEGASYCIDAHAYPDSICLPDTAGWTGAFLEATGICDEANNLVNLRLENTGLADMSEYSDYIIVEDILFLVTDSVDLDQGDFRDIPLAANGSTYTIIADQVDGAPGYSNPIAIVEGCGENNDGEFSIGFSNLFPLNDADPYFDADCPVAENNPPPIDIQGFPIGFEDDNYVQPETNLEYLIRFQNTGIDTTRTIVLRDTLSNHFDISTFKPGASSHVYDIEMDEQGILKVTFENINLPDSFTDELGSFGFFEFGIALDSNAPIGSVVRNKAGIYLDFNQPIITNETFHTIEEDFIEILPNSTTHPTIETVSVKIAPNPFVNFTKFEIAGHRSESYIFQLYNSTGARLRLEELSSSNLIFERNELSPGIYFYQLSAIDGFKHTGRMLIH